MGDSAKRGHNPDMSGARGPNGAKPYKVACDYVKTPKGKQPSKKRVQSYSPDTSVTKR